MDARREADTPRELVALVQRRSLAFLPMFGAVLIAGVVGAGGGATTGSLDPVLMTYAVGFVAMFVLRRWHRRRYGDVRLTESQRLAGRLAGLAMFLAFVAMIALGPRVVPSPLPFTLAVVFAAGLIWDPWRVSAHWFVMVGVLLWLSISHVMGPEWLMARWAHSFLIGIAGTFACVVDHVLMLRLMRRTPGELVMGAGHA